MVWRGVVAVALLAWMWAFICSATRVLTSDAVCPPRVIHLNQMPCVRVVLRLRTRRLAGVSISTLFSATFHGRTGVETRPPRLRSPLKTLHDAFLGLENNADGNKG